MKGGNHRETESHHAAVDDNPVGLRNGDITIDLGKLIFMSERSIGQKQPVE